MPDFLTDIEFQKFQKLIHDESGITFSDTNRPVLESRIRDALRNKELGSAEEYYTLVLSSEDELNEMLDSVTTNLTRFFRNQPHFETLEKYVLPEIIKRKTASGDKIIRVWSAGCSTGEEPYSIAMVLQENVPAQFKIEVLASDISLKSLMTARAGFYEDSKIVGIPDKYLDKFLEKKSSGWQFKDVIRKLIQFDYHNLTHDPPNSNVDIVFCRNVIIYFDEVGQKSVIDGFWRAMAPQSYLFIGHSESLFGMDTKFVFFKTPASCIYKKEL